MCTERGHDDAFMQLTSKFIKTKVVKFKSCTFIMGSTGSEPRKPVMCGDYPADKDFPVDFVPITGTHS